MRDPHPSDPTGNDTVGRRLHRLPTGPKTLLAVFLLWGAIYVSKMLSRLGVINGENFYPNPVARWITGLLQLLPFSVVEVAGALLVAACIIGVLLPIRCLYKGTRRLKTVMLRGFLYVLAVVLLVDCWGGLATGVRVKYLSEDLHWLASEMSPIEPSAIATWANELIVKINAHHDAITNEQTFRRRSQEGFRPFIDAATDRGLERSLSELHVTSDYTVPFIRSKPLLLSTLLYRIGLLGYFSPYTQEVNYVFATPEIQLPYAIAHEKAHALGIGREDEATFLGYLACAYSGDVATEQSGYWHVLTLLLLRLRELDEPRYLETVAKMSPVVRQQFEDSLALGRHYDPGTFDWFESAWDISIQVGGDARGLSAYSDLSVIYKYARQNGDSILPLPVAASPADAIRTSMPRPNPS